MSDDRTLVILRKTRKAYIIEYTCGLFLLAVIGVLWFKGIKLRPNIKYFIFGLALISFMIPEYSRLLTKYKITDSKLIIRYGIIKQDKLNVYWAPLGFVPNINSKQNRIERILNYGTVYIASGGDPNNSFQIRDISKPQKILKMIEELVAMNRHGATSGHKKKE